MNTWNKMFEQSTFVPDNHEHVKVFASRPFSLDDSLQLGLSSAAS
jgi:hypothetical protein